MNGLREHLIDRMIRLYGFENPIVIDFCRLCESTIVTDKDLEVVVKSHEEHPADTIGELEGWSGEVW